MKRRYFFFFFLYSLNCYAQNIKLEISTPQPRLGQSFTVSFSSDILNKEIFTLPANLFSVESYGTRYSVPTEFSTQLKALKTGPNEIGPLKFSINGKNYTTDVIRFTVADSLPNVNSGVWIRHAPFDKTTSYILIDQRIPTTNRVIQNAPNSLMLSADVDDEKYEAELETTDSDDMKIEFWGSNSLTQPDFSGKGTGFKSLYKCYKITVKTQSKTVLTRANFNNLPEDLNFKNIELN